MSRAEREKADPIPTVDRQGLLPLSLAQQRLWFLSQWEEASKAYHLSGHLRLIGKLDRSALERALDQVVRRHEALRTRFVQVDGEPRQVIDAAGAGLTLAEYDLGHRPSARGSSVSLKEETRAGRSTWSEVRCCGRA